MVVTQSGMVGVAVASHVTEELSTVPVRVPTRNLHMAEEVAGDWGGEHRHKHAIRINARVIVLKFFIQCSKHSITCVR